MRSSKLFSAGIGFVFVIAVAIAAISLTGCKKSDSDDKGTSSKQPASAFLNVTCPMMGTAIDAANVPAGLTRDFKGKKVAFCCDKCPAKWDELTDDQRQAKLGPMAAK